MAEAFGYTYDASNINAGNVLSTVDIGWGKGVHADLSNAKEIYRLEYITAKLAQKLEDLRRQGRDKPSIHIKFNNMLADLERRLDIENRLLAFAMYIWSSYDITGIDVRSAEKKLKSALSVVGDVEQLVKELVTVGKLPNGIPVDAYIFVGVVLPNGKKVLDKHVRALEKFGFGNVWSWVKRMAPDQANERIQKYVNKVYLEPKYKEMLNNFANAINAVKAAKTKDEKLVAFHTALTTVHCGGTIANNVYGHAAVQKLTELSKTDVSKWDAEISQILRT